MISAEQNDSGHSQTFADWYSHIILAEAARCQELTYFFPQRIFSTFPNVSLGPNSEMVN